LEPFSSIDKFLMLDPDGRTIDLKQLDPSEARLSLGVWQTLTGDKMKRNEVLLERSIHLGVKCEQKLDDKVYGKNSDHNNDR